MGNKTDEDSYVMKLSRPIEAHGETLSELVLTHPKAGKLRGVTFDNSVGDILTLIEAGANIPPVAADEILLPDVLSHSKAITAFFGITQ